MFQLIISVFVVFFSLAANAKPEYQPEVLEEVLQRVSETKNPVVIFDIDDTITDTRHRNIAIINEFKSEPATFEKYPAETETLKKMSLESTFYYVDGTFNFFHIENATMLKEQNDYWRPRYYSDEYAKIDTEIDGAKSYVNSVRAAGARIVYLTGRDEPRMKTGTITGLRRNGFPLEGTTRLFMKPNKEVPDLEYKIKAIEEIGTLGEVVAAFENEPANINAMHAYFKEATAVFIDSRHSNKPDVPAEGITWIKNYK